jgi:phosphoribosyl 1,2-cyclic phosphodiesterase
LLTLTTLASGSSGNCLLFSDGKTHILIDAGISCRRIKTSFAALGLDPTELSAVLVTHEHSDHISGLATLTKQLQFPVWASRGTAGELNRRIAFLEDRLFSFSPGSGFSIGDLHIGTFAISHDAAQPTGYTITDGHRTAAVVTDLGMATEPVLAAVSGADLLVLESNHDETMLRQGPYPAFLKSRILGNSGHLSNGTAGEVACTAVSGGATTVVLAHLSKENNTPKLAHETVSEVLRRSLIDPMRDLSLTVAPRDVVGEILPV